MFLEGSHWRSRNLVSRALWLPKPVSRGCNRTHFQMRIFLVSGCQVEDLKMARKMAVLHPQMAKFSASGGGKGPPAAPAAGFDLRFASTSRKSAPDRPGSPKIEPSSLVFGLSRCQDPQGSNRDPLPEVHDVRAPAPCGDIPYKGRRRR